MKILTRIASRFATLLALGLSIGPSGCMHEAGAPAIVFPNQDEALTSRLTHYEAIQMAEAALQGFNEGDYAVFSAHWAEPLRDGIGEGDFLAYREEVVAKVGLYVSILDVRRAHAEAEGHIAFLMQCAFEEGEALYKIVVPVDGVEVVGAFLVPLDAE